MGRLLDDLQRKMQLKAEGRTKQPRLLVHSTHDTALAGLCQTLDVFDERCARRVGCFGVAGSCRAVGRRSRRR